MKNDAGDKYQQETKYRRDNLPAGGLDWPSKPELYKKYGEAPRINLDRPQDKGGNGLWEVISNRRSIRQFKGKPVEITELSQLLWATQGITASFRQYDFRAAPSAGALYPIETYLVVNRVDGLKPGIYHYEIEHHTLSLLKEGLLGPEAARAAMDQGMVERADVVFIWSAIFERSKWKYRQRAYRYIYLDAGHIGQNLALASVAIGLGSCQIAAFFDDELNQLLGLDGIKESVLYLSVVGRPE